MSKPLQGRVVIVTGAAGGIGRACAITLAEAGARLVVTDIVDCDETIAAIRETQNEAAFIKADVGVESDVEELVAQSGGCSADSTAHSTTQAWNSARLRCTN